MMFESVRKLVGVPPDYGISDREKINSHLPYFSRQIQMRHPLVIAEEHMEHVPSGNETWQLTILHLWMMLPCSYGHLLDISGYKWDYTFYKWGFVSTYNWYFGP